MLRANGGLSSADATRRLAEDGPNIIFTPQRVGFFDILWEEVREPMILLLLVVGVLYSILGEPGDAITIFAVILLLTLAEVQNEFRAKRAVQRLQEIASPRATVRRDGEIGVIDASAVVRGDALVLSSGTRIAADARVTSTVGLQVDEAAITGESFPAEKAPGDALFAGTIVVSGDGEAVVTATASATKLGALAEGLKTVKPPRTPLQKAMKELSGKLVWVAVFFSVTIPVIGALRGKPWQDMVLTGLSLSFATIPEEMPIIITMVLGLGAYRLSKESFLVKRLSAAETMGAISAIVTDKTGTLTESKMTLTRVDSPKESRRALETALGAVTPTDHTPIDAAIRERARKEGASEHAEPVVRERELGVGGKTKAVIRQDGTLYVSGAPEEVFARCSRVPEEIGRAFEESAAEGNRVVAVASRVLPPEVRGADWPVIERDLEFGALLSFSDPPRAEVPAALAKMSAAGVRTVMVTGDYPATAAAIARAVGISCNGNDVVTGSQLDAMDDIALKERVGSACVFARTTPEHKYRIVEALHARGLLVAATGDGINDALALKGADVGVAMGVRGTDVAREAADAILADDNYATIARAVFEGRVFYDNLRKGVKYYLSVKTALIGVFLLPAVLGLPLPFSPVQIILLELFMDLAASAGFVAEPGEPDVSTRPPVEMKTQILDGPQLRDLLLKGFVLFTAVMGVYAYAGAAGMSAAQQGTLAFSAWMIGHVALAVVSRSDRQPLARVGLFSNRVVNVWALATAAFLLVGVYVPALGGRIDLTPVPAAWLLTVAVAVTLWTSLLEVRKYLRQRTAEHRQPAVGSQVKL